MAKKKELSKEIEKEVKSIAKVSEVEIPEEEVAGEAAQEEASNRDRYYRYNGRSTMHFQKNGYTKILSNGSIICSNDIIDNYSEEYFLWLISIYKNENDMSYDGLNGPARTPMQQPCIKKYDSQGKPVYGIPQKRVKQFEEVGAEEFEASIEGEKLRVDTSRFEHLL